MRTTKMISLTFLVGLYSLLIIPKCTSGANPQQQLDQGRATWSFARNDGYYDFQYSESGFEAGMEGFPWRVEVRDGEVKQAFTADGDPLPPDSPEVPTIDTVFGFIQEAIDTQSDTIRVAYNQTHGYPARVFLDEDAEGRGDEYLVLITDVQPQPTYDLATEQAKLDEARSLWDSAGLSDYTFQYNLYCFGCWFANYPWIVQVLERQNARAIDSTGATVVQDSVRDVNDVFDRIQSSLDAKAFEVHVTYSPTLGYPQGFFYNYDPNIIDEEFSIDISNLAAIGNPLAELRLARDKWQSNGLLGYSYRLHKPNADSEQAYPWMIQVHNGSPVSITDASGNAVAEVEGAQLRMEDHLDTVETALALGTTQVEVTYSKPWGFPRTISIDPGTGGEVESLEVSKFRPYRSMVAA